MLFVLTGIAVIAILVATNWIRRVDTPHQLEPNCLLSRHPLVFISGIRSPFYFLNYWNSIPEYLRAHGYEVVELNLAWRQSAQRRHEILEFLEVAHKEDLKFHLFFDSSSTADARWVAELHHPAVTSIQTADLDSGLRVELTARNIIFKLACGAHRLYVRNQFNGYQVGALSTREAQGAQYLKIAISLAEKDIEMPHNDQRL